MELKIAMRVVGDWDWAPRTELGVAAQSVHPGENVSTRMKLLTRCRLAVVLIFLNDMRINL